MVQIVYHKRTANWSFRNPENMHFYPLSICGYWDGRYDVWHKFPSIISTVPSRSVLAGSFETLADAMAWVIQAIDHL